MLLYYITDRNQFPGDEEERGRRLLEKISEAARADVDFVQLREKDLSTRELELLATEAVRRVRACGSKTRLLINSRTDVAIAAGVDGVHLRSKDISSETVREVWQKAKAPGNPMITVSCHTREEVIAAKKSGADFVVFGPVFESTKDLPTTGVDLLRVVSRSRVPVFALGGVTLQNAHLCGDAGVSGIAGIRLFQEDDVQATVLKIRAET